MSGSSNPLVESPSSRENWFRNQWKKTMDEGLTNYILITAKRLQVGKTSLAMRIQELVEEWFQIPFSLDWNPEKPLDFSKCNLGFDPLWYLDRQENVPENTPLCGDEWNRAAGQRKWYTPENQDFAENMQTTAYMHIHGLFPLPHQAMTDNALVGICTAHIIVEAKGYATVYSYERDQLNRAFKQRTPHVGELTFKKPSAKRWHTYRQMRQAYTGWRRSILRKRMRQALEDSMIQEATPSKDKILEMVIKNPEAYKGSTGRISAVKVAAKHKVSWTKANIIVSDARDALADSEKPVVAAENG